MVKKIIDIDLAGEVKEFINSNDDVKFEKDGLEKKIMDSNNFDLLKVTKKIGSAILITNVELVDKEFIEKVL
ncbi:MAG: hypothetical protein B6U68_02990 [Candidatus Aenigmarchaeota archaeon ex4484_14]|nr:MAG: hypothetical protein B6U68_02990 [Candidatus Aenigmarchaeota archaeon ex4484_14]